MMYIGRRHLFSPRQMSKFGTAVSFESIVVWRTEFLYQYGHVVLSRSPDHAWVDVISFYFKNYDLLVTQCCRCSPTGEGCIANG